MRETILALLALSIASSISIALMSTGLQNRHSQLEREIGVMAAAAALQVMDYIDYLAFDERTTPQSINRRGLPPSGEASSFSIAARFGSNPPCDIAQPYSDLAVCDDIDDVDMKPDEWQLVNFRLKDSLVVPFEVNVQVIYLDTNSLKVLPRHLRSDTKKVTIKVRSVLDVEEQNAKNDLVSIERYFTYDENRASALYDRATKVCQKNQTILVDHRLLPLYVRQGGKVGACK